MEIVAYFRGSKLQNYFTRPFEDNLKAIIKPQYVDHIRRAAEGNVGQLLSQRDERGMKQDIATDLELVELMDRNLTDLSGGELQRFPIQGKSWDNFVIIGSEFQGIPSSKMPYTLEVVLLEP